MPKVIKRLSEHDMPRVKEFYEGLTPQNRPANIEYVGNEMFYDLVEGSYPACADVVWKAAAAAIWAAWDLDRTDPLPIRTRAYCDYVRGRVTKDIDLASCKGALSYIMDYEYKFTPVRMYHGDLTLSNCVVTYDGRVVFLDPGHARGLPCRELDEAKLLQSLDGFDALRYGTPRAYSWTVWAQPIHYALLLTHYVRLVPHMKTRGRPDLVKFACQRIEELGRWL